MRERKNLEKLLGQKVADAAGHVGTILAATYAFNYEAIKQYDTSGWLDEHWIEEYELPVGCVLVACEMTYDPPHKTYVETNIFVLGYGGVELLDDRYETYDYEIITKDIFVEKSK